MSEGEGCVCGCSRRVVHRHHVLYEQEIKRLARTLRRPAAPLLRDDRILVPVAKLCHDEHHARIRPLRLSVLPDGCFLYVEELMGPGPGSAWLGRYYAGDDPRLDAMHERWEAAR